MGIQLTGHPTPYWHRLEDGRVQCDLSTRFCQLHEGQRGLCFVRARHEDQIVLTTYGRSSGHPPIGIDLSSRGDAHDYLTFPRPVQFNQ